MQEGENEGVITDYLPDYHKMRLTGEYSYFIKTHLYFQCIYYWK